jgi:hypothetical protein
MASWFKLAREHMGGRDAWDLCPPCWKDFLQFLSEVLG